jgi:protein-disulfide isomerase
MESRSSSLTIPGAIIIAATIIAIALIYIFHPKSAATTQTIPGQIPDVTMQPVSANDHILGNPNAPIKIVEYSDPSCPFCKLFNPTMVKVISQYGPSGQVAWVYRSFPLNQPDQDGNVLHPNAGTEAQAFECAALIGSNDKFWAFEKEWYSVIPEDGANRTSLDDMKQILKVGTDVGLDSASFSDCVTSGRTKAAVQRQYLDGINAGVSGTPYSIIITPSGSKIPFAGASYTYSDLKATIDALIGTIPSSS